MNNSLATSRLGKAKPTDNSLFKAYSITPKTNSVFPAPHTAFIRVLYPLLKLKITRSEICCCSLDKE